MSGAVPWVGTPALVEPRSHEAGSMMLKADNQTAAGGADYLFFLLLLIF